jgi:hypothetical protein
VVVDGGDDVALQGVGLLGGDGALGQFGGVVFVAAVMS